MKFKCPGCNQILKRDMRRVENKREFIKKRYKSYCDYAQRDVICKKEV